MRETISTRTRFEVLKRDQFKCQYCGKAAPEAILHVDHIDPVSKGGGKEILNLVTACSDCNLGKSNIKLDDQSALAKQRLQAEQLESIVQQKKLMAEWVKGLSEIEELETKAIKEYIESTYKVYLSEFGLQYIKKAIKKYGNAEVMISVDISADNYLKDSDDKEQRKTFLDKIERICFYREKDRKDPIGAEARNLANLANKIWYRCYPQELQHQLREYHESGIPFEMIRAAIIKSTGIMNFTSAMEALDV